MQVSIANHSCNQAATAATGPGDEPASTARGFTEQQKTWSNADCA